MDDLISNNLCLQGEGLRSSYIAQENHHEALDQTDLNIWWRCILGGDGGVLKKLEARRLGGRPENIDVVRASPLWSPFGARFDVVSS